MITKISGLVWFASAIVFAVCEAKAGLTAQAAAEVSQKAYELVQFHRCDDLTSEEVQKLPGCEKGKALTRTDLNAYAEDLFFTASAEYQKQWSACRMQKSTLYERELARDGKLKKTFLKDFIDRLERLHTLYEKTDARLQKICRDKGHYMLKVTRDGQQIYEGCGKFAELNAGNSSSQFTDPELIAYAREAERLLTGIPESQSSAMQKLISEYAFSRKAKSPQAFLTEANAQAQLRMAFRQAKNEAHADFSALSVRPSDRLPESVRARMARNTDFMNFYLNELRAKRASKVAGDPALEKLWCRVQGRYVKGPEYIANSLNAATWLFAGGSALRLGVVAWTGRGLFAARAGGLFSRTSSALARGAAWASGGAAATRALMDFERVCVDADLSVEAKPATIRETVMDRLRQCGDVEVELKEIARGSCYATIAEHGLEAAGMSFALAYKGARAASGAKSRAAVPDAIEKSQPPLKNVIASPVSSESLAYLPPAQRLNALRQNKRVEALTAELHAQLEKLNQSLKEGELPKKAHDLDPTKLEELKSATMKYMRTLGLSVDKDPSDPALIVLTELPSYHPNAKLFAQTRDKLDAKFTFNVFDRVEGKRGGYQGDTEISSWEFAHGTVRSKTSLHEIGHLSSDARAKTNPLELANTEMLIEEGNIDRLPKELRRGPVPELYRTYLNYDELKQYAKDLWRGQGRGAKDLGITEWSTARSRATVKKIAESVVSQSDYVLSKLKKGDAFPWDGTSHHVYFPVHDDQGVPIGHIHFNLQGFQKPQEASLRLADEVTESGGKTRFVEKIFGHNGLEEVEISHDTYNAIMTSWDRRLIEREAWARERLIEMAESNKAEAKYVLRRWHDQPLPK